MPDDARRLAVVWAAVPACITFGPLFLAMGGQGAGASGVLKGVLGALLSSIGLGAMCFEFAYLRAELDRR